MKILYILTKSGIGGAQKYVKDLADNLDKNKFDSRVLYGDREVRWLSNKTYPWFLFFNDWMAIFELVNVFKKENPDIIHLNSSKAGVLGSLAAAIYNKNFNKKIRVVFTAHGWVFNPTNEISKFVRQFYVLLHKFAAKFQDKIICVSEYDYNLALEYDICPEEKLSTIHNGINADMKFLSKKESRQDLVIKIFNDGSVNSPQVSKLEEKYQWVGSVGRLVKEKNYETFIGAAKFVKNTYFFIIGDGLELSNLKSLILKLKLSDRFFIISPSGNDAQYLKAFDVFAMSSIKEGLPYILLEAMAAELPIVVTEAGGIPEMIKNHENGLMVSQKNPEALARAIGGLIENKEIAKELSRKAKEIVKDKFSLEKMLSETEKVYEK